MAKLLHALRFILICGFFLIIFENCRPSQVLISPIPSDIKSMEGYASLRITTGQSAARSKFSFLLSLPNQGRMEVSDFLGRSIYQIFIVENKSYLVVPSKKVFWQGEEEEIIGKLM